MSYLTSYSSQITLSKSKNDGHQWPPMSSWTLINIASSTLKSVSRWEDKLAREFSWSPIASCNENPDMGVSKNNGTPKTPQNDHFSVGKPMVVGYQHFRKHLYVCPFLVADLILYFLHGVQGPAASSLTIFRARSPKCRSKPILSLD